MADNVFINGRAAVHAGSSGKSVAFPDVCLCPPSPPYGPIPTPLTNTAKAEDLAGCAATVTVEGNRIAHAKSYVARSTGNEVAKSTGGGIATQQTRGRAYFQTYSRNVIIEGKPAVRHLDLLTHNHLAETPGNTPPSPWMSTMIAGQGPAPRSGEEELNEGKDWLAFELTDPDGKPIPGARYRVTTAKGNVRSGVTLQDGKVKLRRLAKGTCKLEWLDRVADVSKAGSKAKLAGSPPADEVATGAQHRYVLKLEKIKIRVLEIWGRPRKSARCDVTIPPFLNKTVKCDGKGWLELWCPADAKHVDLRVLTPFERRTRRVQLKPLAGDDKDATKQRLWNLGFYGGKNRDEDALAFTNLHALEKNDAVFGEVLEEAEKHYYETNDDDDKAEVENTEVGLL
jgi:hypothetical protein